MELPSSHKYVKNKCGTILTEHLLNAVRRPQTSKGAKKSPCNWIGQKKKKKREREKGIWMGPVPLGGSCERVKVLACWEVPSLVGRSAGTGWSFGASEESAATSIQRAKQRETCTDSQCHRPALPSLRCWSAGAGGVWVLRLGLRTSDLGRRLGLAARRSPLKGLGCCTP